jgi:N-acetylglutamate synthase-like GNAT family acetyltransferase
MNVEVREPRTEAEFEEYLALRWRLLRAPHGEPRDDDAEADSASVHLIACVDGRIVGAGCLRMVGRHTVHHRQLAVDADYRTSRVGTALSDAMHRQAAAMGARRAVIYARTDSIGYFEKRDFYRIGAAGTAHGGIEHIRMEKWLNPRVNRIAARFAPALHRLSARLRHV